jgi:ribose transport system substrate-binding protein
MKKFAPIAALIVLIIAIAVIKNNRTTKEVEPIVWYGMMPHPYISEVQTGAKAASEKMGIPILLSVGQEWTQDNESANIKALATRGHKAFSIFPGDPAGANGLFGELTRHSQLSVAYGAEPNLPTPAAFTVATDIKVAAMEATEELVRLMGNKGSILNVLETVTDVNTKKRDEGINEVADKYPNVKIAQTISDMSQVSVAKEKIQSALAARGKEIDGIITTGYNPTIAAAAVLTEWHKNPNHKRIRFIGIDTGPTVLQAIRNGSIDATMAQNPFGHGYISCLLLGKMVEGWTPRKDYQFVNAGNLIVNKDNLDTYITQIRAITDQIAADIETKYLSAPTQ